MPASTEFPASSSTRNLYPGTACPALPARISLSPSPRQVAIAGQPLHGAGLEDAVELVADVVEDPPVHDEETAAGHLGHDRLLDEVVDDAVAGGPDDA